MRELSPAAPRRLQSNLFTTAAKQFTELQARTFAVWTATTIQP